MLKKMTLLAMAVGALIAFAVPAVASAADQWTYEDAAIPNNGSEVVETYEGLLSFTTPSPPLPVHSTFGCQVTVAIVATGTANGTGHAEVVEFNPTTTECSGTGVFTGCHLIADESNPPWTVDIGATDLTVTGPITIHNTYTSCPAGPESNLAFNSITAETTSTTAGIQTIHIHGVATNGVTTAFGTVHAEGEGLLGVDY